jgi:hypothetical protein
MEPGGRSSFIFAAKLFSRYSRRLLQIHFASGTRRLGGAAVDGADVTSRKSKEKNNEGDESSRACGSRRISACGGTTVIGTTVIGIIVTGTATTGIVTGITAKCCPSSLGFDGALTISPARKCSLAGLFYARSIERRC